jgi:hypothetical protein
MAAQEAQEYVRLVEIYGTGCVRLVRLLQRAGSRRNKQDNFNSHSRLS